MSQRVGSSSCIVPVALFAAGVGLRVLILAVKPFDGLYGQDPFAYYDFAQQLRLAAGTGGTLPAFFWPLGYPTLLGSAFAIFGTSPEIGQAVSIVLGALLPVLVYILAQQLKFSRAAGFIAALIMLTGGQILQSSVVIMADIPALFWAMLSTVTLLKYTETHHLGWLVLTAVALAVCCITRWLYLLMVIPYGAVFILERGKIRHAIIAGLCAALIFIPQFGFSIGSPFPTFNHAWVQGWSPTNALRREFVNVDGRFSYQDVNAVFYAETVHDPLFLAPIFTPLLIVGLWALRSRLSALALLGGWGLLPYLFLSGIPYQNIRFPLIMMPAIALLCGAGIDYLLKRIKRPIRPLVYGAVAGLGAVWMLTAGLTLTHNFIVWQTQDRDIAVWASQQVPAGATVYTSGLTLTLQHRTSLNVIELYYETPETLAERWQRGQADYLLINLWQIDNQWYGREPYIATHWLLDHRNVERLGQSGYYTLFRLGDESRGALPFSTYTDT